MDKKGQLGLDKKDKTRTKKKTTRAKRANRKTRVTRALGSTRVN